MEEYPNRKKVRRRSFVIPEDHDKMLELIRQACNRPNLSKAFLFCIEFTFEQLSRPAPETNDERLLNLATKNHTLLRYLLIEMVKTHKGEVAYGEVEKAYLHDLFEEIKGYHQKVQKEHQKIPGKK